MFTAEGKLICINPERFIVFPAVYVVVCPCRREPSGRAFMIEPFGKFALDDVESLVIETPVVIAFPAVSKICTWLRFMNPSPMLVS